MAKATQTAGQLTRTSRRGLSGDAIFGGIIWLAGLGIVILTILFVGKLLRQSQLGITTFGLGFITSTDWDPIAEKFGALPYIYGTVVSSLIAVVLSGSVGVGTAIFLIECCPRKLRGPIAALIELLAAIPSVVYGFWGIAILAPWFAHSVEPFLRSTLGFLPLFRGPAFGVGMLTAGVILAIMILSTVSAVSRDVIAAVPPEQRQGMLALGATRWETIARVILPYARTGIIGALILGLGRALGETIAATMVIGNNPQITASLFAPAATMATVIANQFTEATSNLQVSVLIELGLLLFVLTFLVNVGAQILIWYMDRRLGDAR
jgi:phosphate transport system permease protein